MASIFASAGTGVTTIDVATREVGQRVAIDAPRGDLEDSHQPASRVGRGVGGSETLDVPTGSTVGFLCTIHGGRVEKSYL